MPPVDFPMLLSGNFGELRGGHFHTGIDIKTQGVTGKNVRAAADGYVARIFVSPTGYGNALYVHHPDGTVTVYGHLREFEPEIADYVREMQYRRKSFAVDLYPEKNRFPVKQGEVIALSGNSGSSGGPHLHFEVRDRASGQPLNVLAGKYLTGVRDDVPARYPWGYVIAVDTVASIPAHRELGKYAVKKKGRRYGVAGGRIVQACGSCYFAVEVTDGKTGTNNTMGLYGVEQFVDGVRNFGFAVDRVSFDRTRYMNAMVWFPRHRQTRYDVLKTYVTENNELPIYRGLRDRGVVRLDDEEIHSVEIRLRDDNGNESVLVFGVRKGETGACPEAEGVPVRWNETAEATFEGLKVTIPAGALYESVLLTTERRPAAADGFSAQYVIHDEGVPLQKAMTVEIVPENLPGRLCSKACIVSLDRNGGKVYEGGRWHDGVVSTATRSFGTYYITVDTVPPRIVPRFAPGADLRGKETLTVILDDDLSGIKEWNAYVDGEWTLFDYDPKTKSLVHRFRYARYPMGGRHTLRVEAVDGKGNRRAVERAFLR